MNNTIFISRTNLSLNAAKRACIDNENNYFQYIAFYCASASGNRPNSTGLTIKFDERLKVLGPLPFSKLLTNSNGEVIESRGRDSIEQGYIGDNTYFVSTASGQTITSDGFLYFVKVQFPEDVEVGDEFTTEILTDNAEFLFVDSTASEAEKAAMTAWTKTNGVSNGKFTIV